MLGHHYLDFKGWPEQSPDRLCWHSGDHTEPAPTFSAGALPSTHSGKGHEAIHQQSTDLPPGKSTPQEAERWGEAELAAQGGVCLSSTDRWQLGTDSGTEPVCNTQEMFQYNIKTKARPTSGWGWGGGPSAAHPSRSKDFFLSPRFFTPFRESAAAPSVL